MLTPLDIAALREFTRRKPIPGRHGPLPGYEPMLHYEPTRDVILDLLGGLEIAVRDDDAITLIVGAHRLTVVLEVEMAERMAVRLGHACAQIRTAQARRAMGI